MKNVYVLIGRNPYEDSNVLAVCTTREAADQARRDYEKRANQRRIDWQLVEDGHMSDDEFHDEYRFGNAFSEGEGFSFYEIEEHEVYS